MTEAFARIPIALPVDPMLCKSVPGIPQPDAPGDLLYEPKWDGFRCLVIRDGDDVALIGTNFGQPKHPAWTANLLAHPDAAVEVGPVRLAVRAEQVDEATVERVFPSFVAVYPGYADYLGRREGLAPRMFRLRPVS